VRVVRWVVGMYVSGPSGRVAGRWERDCAYYFYLFSFSFIRFVFWRPGEFYSVVPSQDGVMGQEITSGLI
jgi:hypothetical protein